MTIKKSSFKEFRKKYSQNYYESLGSNEWDNNFLAPLLALGQYITKRNYNEVTKDKSNNFQRTVHTITSKPC